jgi:O-acetyl-ADP-ribose deacetylase (regulator of RNase III)
VNNEMGRPTEQSFLNGRVSVCVGDITRQKVIAVVNAANSSLLGGGGVDGAIHRAGGPQVLEACQHLRRTTHPNGLSTGDAVITTGGRLPAQYIIHTVGPIYGENKGRDAELLTACYQNSLGLARARLIPTIAFPAISTGLFAYPPEEAATVSSQAIKGFLTSDELIKEVRLVFFRELDALVFIEHQKFE